MTERNTITQGEVSSPIPEAVQSAAIWLADQSNPPTPLIPALRGKFDLTAVEACRASELARRFRKLRRAFG